MANENNIERTMKTRKHTKLFEWQERCKTGQERCARCGETRALTIEHIVPVSLLEQFALGNPHEFSYDYEENFEILCYYCNQQKANRIDVKNPKTYKVLETIIDRAKEYYGIVKK